MIAKTKKKSLTERFEGWTKRQLFLAVLVTASLVVSSLLTVGSAIVNGVGWIDRKLNWEKTEFTRLRSVRAGFSIDQFDARFGPPLFEVRKETPERTHKISLPDRWDWMLTPLKVEFLVESTYRRRGYWVQAIADPTGTVLMFAVTSCDDGFHPRWHVQERTSEKWTVTLRSSQFADVAPADQLGVDVFIGATANQYMYEHYYGANPGNYQSFAWGVNDACPQEAEAVSSRLPPDPALQDLMGFHLVYPVRLARISALRENSVNTYAETAPGVYFPQLLSYFQIGVDRILTRTVPESQRP